MRGIRSRLVAGLLAIASLACVEVFTTATASAAGFTQAPGSPFASAGATGALALGDLNGDRSNDAVVADPVAGKVVVLLGSRRGVLSQAPVPPVSTGGTKPSAVAIADLNGDARQDLVVANDGTKNVSVLLGDGAGGFSAAAKSPFLTGEARPVSATVGDFNGDAKTDVAVVNFSSGNVSVMLGDGLGGLGRAPGSPTSTNGLHPGPAAAGDFNGDGKLDLAVANESGNVVVLKGDGTGRLSRAGASPFGLSPTALGAGDFNGDGKLDVAVANATGTVTILLGDGTGGLSLLPAPAPVNLVGTAPSSLAVADLDFDGRLDIVVANAGSGTVSMLRGGGAARFAPAQGMPVSTGGASPSALALGEMNGDGKLDLVAVNAGSASVAVLLNAVTPATFVSFPASPVVGDQITFAYSSAGAIDALDWDLDGSGTFDDGHGPTASRAFAAAGTYPISLRVTDLDGAVTTSTQMIVVGTPVALLGAAAPVVSALSFPALMAPFPIVRVTGRTAIRGARIRELVVLAPEGAKVTVRCSGKGCPFKSWRRLVGSKRLAIKPLSGRFLLAGITLEVRVYKPDLIGKYTRLVIRKRKPPTRTDLCLAANSSSASKCPTT